MYNKILKLCLDENINLIKKKLSIQNFGNVSTRINKDLFTIKPSGYNLEKLNFKDMPIVKIKDGLELTKKLKPSTDTETHRLIYKNFAEIESIAHTHSKYATAWAQTSKSIPNYGTTHSDFCIKSIPCLKFLKQNKVLNRYEYNTGLQIINFFKKNKSQLFDYPGVLIAGHGSFAWSKDKDSSVKNIEIIEFISEVAFYTKVIGVKKIIPEYLIKKHFYRKNGKKSYYGQRK